MPIDGSQWLSVYIHDEGWWGKYSSKTQRRLEEGNHIWLKRQLKSRLHGNALQGFGTEMGASLRITMLLSNG